MSAGSLSQLIASTLERIGTRHAFVYPGDPIIDLLEALRMSDVDPVLASREGTAAVMAEATAVLTGVPAVCISTLGPGSTAMVGGVASANLDRAPLLAISGQIERSREPFFTHQVVDHERLYAPVTKWASHLEAASAATILRKALRTAVAERPGAVHLTMHADLASSDVGTALDQLPPIGRPQAVTLGFTVAGATERDVARRLAASRRPAVIAGPSVVRSSASRELATFADAFGAPVVVAPMAKGVIDERHELFAGVLDMACNAVVWDLLAEADLLLLVGFDAVELIKPWTLQVPTIHVDSIPNTDQIYPAEIELVGDIATTLFWLASFAGAPRFSAGEVARHRARLSEVFESGRVAGRLNPSDVVLIARDAAGDDAICTTDVGSHKLLIGQGWQAAHPRRVLMSNGLSAMGFALPAAIAAALSTNAQVFCVVGDGGFAMTQAELALAAERSLELVVLVLCDRSLNRIELKQQIRSIPPTATRLPAVDVVKVAQGLGCDAAHAESAGELEKHLAGGASGRPLVLEVIIDPAQYLSQF